MTVSTRRDFLSTAAATCAACALAKCLPFSVEPVPTFTAGAADLSGQVRVALASVASLKKVGGAVTVTVDGFSDNVLVMHLANGSYAGVSSTCTHAGCPVTFRADKQLVECPCHGARFDLQGNVLRAPAASPLRQVLATYDARSDSIVLDYLSAELAGVVDGTLTFAATSNATLNKVGGQLTYHPNGYGGPLTLVHIDASNFAALSGTCTFADCLLKYDPGTQHLACPCHGCAFDLTGAVVTGPATAALTRYTTAFDGKVVTVTI